MDDLHSNAIVTTIALLIKVIIKYQTSHGTVYFETRLLFTILVWLKCSFVEEILKYLSLLLKPMAEKKMTMCRVQGVEVKILLCFLALC